MTTIPEGLTVRFVHERVAIFGWHGDTVTLTHWQARERGMDLHPRGGRTIARLVDANKVVVAEGVACCGKRDNFNKRLGRSISLGRALDALRTRENAPRGALQ